MESFLRDGVDLQSLGGKTIAGDAHFFDDNMAPPKVRQNLDSGKVKASFLPVLFTFLPVAD
jgi:hypothetical protein